MGLVIGMFHVCKKVGLVTATFHISEHVCEKVGLVTAMMFHVSEHV